MSTAVFLYAGIVATAASASHHQGPISITEDGKTLKLNVVALTANLVTSHDEGSSITMKWGGATRAFVVKDPMDDMPVENYYNFTLINKELSYDVDLSTVGCSCNAALFFVSMPGYNSDGSMAHGSYNPYYCDASDVGGVWCWEHDTLESNKYTMLTTPHKCSSPAGGYISSCDRTGCSTHAHSVDPNGMCPDSHCKIDTRHPFRITQTYDVANGSMKLNRISNRLVQGNSSFEWTACDNGDYLEQMTSAMGSMKMVFQLWGSSNRAMSWLDGMTGCTGDCNKDTASVTFSNIEINSLDHPPTPTPPTPPSPPSPPVSWKLSKAVNCYQGHGAKDLEKKTGEPCGTMSLVECEQKCNDLSGCTGISMSVGSGDQTCYRRGDIDLRQCDHNSNNYNTWVKSATPMPPTPPSPAPPIPSKWESHPSTNCYSKHGADPVDAGGMPFGILNFTDCEASCLSNDKCRGIVMSQTSDPTRAVNCWRYNNIVLPLCYRSASYNLWLKHSVMIV